MLGHVPVATGLIGGASIPAVGELVLVQFVNGDINHPVIVGRLYDDQNRPPENDAGQAILNLPLDGSAIHVELHGESTAKVVVKLASALSVTVQDDDPVISVDVGGNASADDRQGRRRLDQEPDRPQDRGRQQHRRSRRQGQLTLKGATVNIN